MTVIYQKMVEGISVGCSEISRGTWPARTSGFSTSYFYLLQTSSPRSHMEFICEEAAPGYSFYVQMLQEQNRAKLW